MSKFSEEASQQNAILSEKSKIAVEIVKVTLKQVKEYLEDTRSDDEVPSSSISLNEYLSSLKENYSKIIIADLSDISFNNDEDKQRGQADPGKFAQTKDALIDLRGADFSGSIFGETLDAFYIKDNKKELIRDKNGNVKKSKKFDGVDLTGAIFRDTDLNNTSFKNSNLNNVDFRGADLSSTKFNRAYDALVKSGKEKYIKGIKFSSTSYLMRDYAGIKPALKNQAPSPIEKDKIVNESLRYIFSSDSAIFDPMYIRGSSDLERNSNRELIKLTDEEVGEYLAIIKSSDKKNFALNDFAREIAFNRRNKQISKDTEVIADFSGKANNLNEWITKDDLFITEAGITRAKFDFRGANLNRVNFAGANLQGYDFTDAKLNGASFESANLKKATFNNTQAKDINCFNANLSDANITNQSSFRRAFMAKSKGENTTVKDSDLRYTDIKFGKWDGVNLSNVEADYANISGTSMNNCSLVGVRLRRAKADQVKINGTAILKRVNANSSSMKEAEITNAEFIGCNLDNVYAPAINITGTIIAETSGKNLNIEAANCQGAKLNGDLDGANFQGVNCNGATFDGIKGKIEVDDATIMDNSTKFINPENLSLIKEDEKGKKVKLSPEQHIAEQVQADIAKEHQGASSKIGGVLKNFGKNLKDKGEIVDKPLGMTTGVAIGLVCGGIIAAGIAVAVIAAAGPLLIPLAGAGLVAGVAGGSILAGIAVGGIAGGVIAKKQGICGIAALAAGTLIAGPVGAAIGAFAYFKANKTAKKYTGHDLDTLVSAPLHATGAIVEGIGAGIDPSTEAGKKTQASRAKQQQQHQEQTNNIDNTNKNAVGEVELKTKAKLDREKEKIAEAQGQEKIQQYAEKTIEQAREAFGKNQTKNKDKANNVIDKFKRKAGMAKAK